MIRNRAECLGASRQIWLADEKTEVPVRVRLGDTITLRVSKIADDMNFAGSAEDDDDVVVRGNATDIISNTSDIATINLFCNPVMLHYIWKKKISVTVSHF